MRQITKFQKFILNHLAKKNRGQKIINSPIHEYSKKLGIPVRNPIIFDDKEIDHIEILKPDLIIVVAYGKILPKKLFLEP